MSREVDTGIGVGKDIGGCAQTNLHHTDQQIVCARACVWTCV